MKYKYEGTIHKVETEVVAEGTTDNRRRVEVRSYATITVDDMGDVTFPLPGPKYLDVGSRMKVTIFVDPVCDE